MLNVDHGWEDTEGGVSGSYGNRLVTTFGEGLLIYKIFSIEIELWLLCVCVSGGGGGGGSMRDIKVMV